MNLARRTSRAIAWGQAGRLVEAGLYFLFYLYLARVLGPANYGQFAVGLSLAGACGFLALLGLGPETLGRFLPEISAQSGRAGLRKSLGAVLRIRLASIMVVGGILFMFAPALAARLHFPLLQASLLLLICVFAARSLLDLAMYFLAGLLELRRVAVAKFTAAVVAPAAFLVRVASGGATVRAAWLATALGSAAGAVILLAPFLSSRQLSPAQTAPAAARAIPLRRILAFGMYAWATNFFLFVLGDNTDVLLLGWLLRDRAAIGAYAAAAKIVLSLVALLLGWAALVSVASLSEAWQSEGDRAAGRLLEAQWKLGVLCLAGPLLLVGRYAREILAIFYSPAYEAGAPVVRSFAGLMAVYVMLGFSLGTSALCATNRQRRACVLVGASAAFNVAIEIPLVHRFGIRGAAWATGLSFVVLALGSAAAVRRWIDWQPLCRFAAKVFAAGVLALMPTLWIRADSGILLAAAALVWAAGFFASLACIRPLEEREAESLERIHPWLGRVAVWLAPREGAISRPGPSGAVSWPE